MEICELFFKIIILNSLLLPFLKLHYRDPVYIVSSALTCCDWVALLPSQVVSAPPPGSAGEAVISAG